MTQASLAYRNNAQDIWRGHAPEKYKRLLSYIPARGTILELGAAEGVLSLLMAERGAMVTALEMRQERHDEAQRLKEQWFGLGRQVQSCVMALGDIWDNLDLLQGVETLVAVRAVYYLRDHAASVMAAAHAGGVNLVVLCGNRNRAERWTKGTIPADDGLGEWNRLASLSGMIDLLDEAGFRISTIVSDGDPIVTGRRD